ncbi:hypothetical protein D3C75_1138300 [compost metagenome]
MSLSAEGPLPLIPLKFIHLADLVVQDRIKQSLIQVSSEVNSLFTLALPAAQVGDHQPRMLHQGIGLGEHSCPTIRQSVFSPTGTTLLRDPVGIRQSK